MSTSFIADLEEIVYPSPSDADDDQEFPRIDARRVLPGMFVAELDRPWGDTPLPQGGLLVTNDDELAALRRHCRQVRVDPARSAPDMLDAIKAAAVLSRAHVLTLVDEHLSADSPANGPTPDPGGGADNDSAGAAAGSRRGRAARRTAARHAGSLLPPAAERRDDVHPSVEARARLRALLLASEGKPVRERSGAVARLRTWFFSSGKSGTPRLSSLETLRARYGEAIGATEAAEPAPMRENLPQARVAHARLVAAADALIAQVRQGSTPSLESLDEPVDDFVTVLQQSPDALRWAEGVYAQHAPRPNPASAVALNLACFGRALGMPAQSLRELVLVGLLLDLGKALLPRDLLEHPGVLAPHDYALVQQHVAIGLDLLERSGTLAPHVLRAVAEHHERLDGSGYPRRLRGDEIGLLGRMAAIVDAFSGLTAVRAYANPLSVEDALSALNEWSESLFCRDLVERFVLSIGVFPVGTLVELRGGEIAAVVDRPRGERLLPRLVVLTGPDKGPLRPMRDRSGRQEPDEVYSGAQVRIARGLPAGAYGLRLPDYYGRPKP
ncbi:MAG TPA: HD domain-containing phosphohydrolase [Zeimonas sp.]|nr:HD domain-containing phosphohydrolase [Zeimonas sp.]